MDDQKSSHVKSNGFHHDLHLDLWQTSVAGFFVKFRKGVFKWHAESGSKSVTVFVLGFSSAFFFRFAVDHPQELMDALRAQCLPYSSKKNCDPVSGHPP